jgi:hypothetical protein
MKTVFYYEPITETVANNHSERLGAKAITKIWTDENKSMKIEVTMAGKTIVEAKEKLLNFLSGNGKNKIVELNCEFHLCGKDVVDFFKPFYVSKLFKSGFQFETNDEYYIAWINFEEIEKQYNEVILPNENSNFNFWSRECVPGTMNHSKISMRNAKKIGLLLEISQKIDITSQRNQAMTICNLSEKYGCNPVQLINKYL